MSNKTEILLLEGPLSRGISAILEKHWSVTRVADVAQLLSRAEGAALRNYW